MRRGQVWGVEDNPALSSECLVLVPHPVAERGPGEGTKHLGSCPTPRWGGGARQL